MIRNDNGIFIVLEGGEGAGKSTIIHYLKEALQAHNIPVTILREPGGTEFAEDIRTVFFAHQQLSPETSVYLMNAQRQDNIEKIITPALDIGGVVIADRFTASTHIYQGVLNGKYHDVDDIMVDHEAVNIFVDVQPEVGLKRIADNKRETNYFDEMALHKHQSIYQGFKQLGVLKPESYWDLELNGEREPEKLKIDMLRLANIIADNQGLQIFNTQQLKQLLRKKGIE